MIIDFRAWYVNCELGRRSESEEAEAVRRSKHQCGGRGCGWKRRVAIG